MSEWLPIDSAPRMLCTPVLVCWRGKPESATLLMWKTNPRIVSARARGEDCGPMLDSYFGDLHEYDDYDLSRPENFPTHWLPIPAVPI